MGDVNISSAVARGFVCVWAEDSRVVGYQQFIWALHVYPTCGFALLFCAEEVRQNLTISSYVESSKNKGMAMHKREASHRQMRSFAAKPGKKFVLVGLALAFFVAQAGLGFAQESKDLAQEIFDTMVKLPGRLLRVNFKKVLRRPIETTRLIRS